MNITIWDSNGIAIYIDVLNVKMFDLMKNFQNNNKKKRKKNIFMLFYAFYEGLDFICTKSI